MNRSISYFGLLTASFATALWACSSTVAARSDDTADRALTSAARDAGPRRDAGDVLTPERIADLRTCMAGRWGSAPTRLAIEVAEDFDACATATESAGAAGNSNFAIVVTGWAEPVPVDHSRMRRILIP